MIVYDIRDLGPQLKPVGLLVITDDMINRVSMNWKKGKRTFLFIDEFHVVFQNEFSGNFFNSAWRQFRNSKLSSANALNVGTEFGLIAQSASYEIVRIDEGQPENDDAARVTEYMA